MIDRYYFHGTSYTCFSDMRPRIISFSTKLIYDDCPLKTCVQRRRGAQMQQQQQQRIG